MAPGTASSMSQSVQEVVAKLNSTDEAMQLLAAHHIRLLATKGVDVRMSPGVSLEPDTPRSKRSATKEFFHNSRKQFDAEIAAAFAAGGAVHALIEQIHSVLAMAAPPPPPSPPPAPPEPQAPDAPIPEDQVGGVAEGQGSPTDSTPATAAAAGEGPEAGGEASESGSDSSSEDEEHPPASNGAGAQTEAAPAESGGGETAAPSQQQQAEPAPTLAQKEVPKWQLPTGSPRPPPRELEDPQRLVNCLVQALASLAQEPSCAAIIFKEGLTTVIALLSDITEGVLDTALSAITCLLLLAQTNDARLRIVRAGALPPLVAALDFAPDLTLTEAAVETLANLSFVEANKCAVRDAGGLYMLVRLLGADVSHGVVELAVQALTILGFQNTDNQVEVREQGGIGALIGLLAHADKPEAASLVMAAAEALRVLAQNEGNRAATREGGGFAHLVRLLRLGGEDAALDQVKTLECLGVLCANNDGNKAALREAEGVPVVMGLASGVGPVTERATRLVVTLSLSPAFHGAIRDAGGIQVLKALLEQRIKTFGITALAVKALSNLAVSESTRTGIRLAGCIPALVYLLTEMPTKEVFGAVEEALRRCGVDDLERNAILQTFTYMEGREAAWKLQEAAEAADRAAAEEAAQAAARQAARLKPLSRFSMPELVALLEELGVQALDKFREWGLTGGDLLWLDDTVLDANSDAIPLTTMERLKLRKVQEANTLFGTMTEEPGCGLLTAKELKSWMVARGMAAAEADKVVATLLVQSSMPDALTFNEFAGMFDWVKYTLSGLGVTLK